MRILGLKMKSIQLFNSVVMKYTWNINLVMLMAGYITLLLFV